MNGLIGLWLLLKVPTSAWRMLGMLVLIVLAVSLLAESVLVLDLSGR